MAKTFKLKKKVFDYFSVNANTQCETCEEMRKYKAIQIIS